MTIFTATLFLLLTAIAALSATRIIRTPLPWKIRTAFLAVRFLLLALVAIAFIEPVMVFEQVPAQQGAVPVLVDASKSMRLFQEDSVISRCLSQLETWNTGHPEKSKKFIFYTFGDSMTLLKKDARFITWDHRHSFLPESMKDPLLRHSTAMLLISDGNWSNASLPSAGFLEKNVFFLRLKGERKQPYLQLSLPGFPAVSPVDSPLIASVTTLGVSGARDNAIALSVMEGDKELEKIHIPLSTAGFFKNETKIALKNAPPGRHLYRFEVRSVRDSLVTCIHALHSKLPKQFYYTLYNAHPTLDRRFIRLALERRHFFVESSTAKEAGEARNPDLLVVFDWDQQARQLMNNLRPGGIVLFIGTLPCSNAVVYSAARSQMMRPANGASTGNPFEDLDINKLPPPSDVSFCASLPVSSQNVFLTAALQTPGRPATDTLKVLFTGRFGNRHYIACAARDIWRWDFLPLTVEPDEDRVFAFSDRLIAFSREMLVNALSETLCLFPESTLTESDSLRFRVALPVGLPVPADIRLSCRITSVNNDPFDTTFILNVTGASKQTVVFKPLPSGACRIEASASSKNRRYPFVDSVFIEEDRSEYMVSGQNTSLLQEIAQPVSDLSQKSLHALFFSNAAETRQPVKKTINLNRNWPLLLLIFGLFALEWILRRVLRLDH